MTTLFEQERERMMRTSPRYRKGAITEAARIMREGLDPIDLGVVGAGPHA